MHFLPILSTLRRHRTAAALIVLEIALTCAIVSNAVFLIRERLASMDTYSGLAEDEIVRVQLTGISDPEAGAADAITAQDLAGLRAIPGVKSATVSNMVPFGNSSWNTGISTIPDDPDSHSAAQYMGGPGQLEAFGVKIIAGRDFTADEYIRFDDARAKKAIAASVIITRKVAERMFPGESAVGKSVYINDKQPQRVVGVIDTLERPNNVNGLDSAGYAMVLPISLPYNRASNYVLRVDPARRAEVIKAADGVLEKVDPNRIILKRQTFDQIRADHFKQDRSMAYLLTGVSLALLIITALGIVGLASFWVQQRTRQIGVRRALGATRSDILHYFQTENFILATIGIVLGMAIAYAINLLLMSKYSIARLPATYLPIGALVLWGLGQIAVLGPAMRAATIPPATATRSV